MKGKDKWLWIVILGIGLLFRLYHFELNFSFAHDQDLYSWIAKDIVVNHHWRLVGQITSVDGVFIGPAYYYLMAAVYALRGMDPMTAILPITIIGLATIISIGWTFGNIFGKRVGQIAAFIYAVSWGMALFDRWSVPTQPTMLWSIWFLYLILAMYKGEIKLLPLYGLLVGLLWHIHIALLPIVPLPIVAYLISPGSVKDKFLKIQPSRVWMGILIFLVISSPFWVFEIKYGFSQTKSILAAAKLENYGPTGWQKFDKVTNALGREIQQRLVNGYDQYAFQYSWLALVGMGITILINKNLGVGQFCLTVAWMGLIAGAQYWSKKPVSEYYFSNILPIVVLYLTLLVNGILKIRKYGRMIVVGLAVGYTSLNIIWMINKSVSSESYFYRKQVVEYIRQDAIKHDLSCLAINYIANFGNGVGFRYLFWYNDITLVRPSKEVPIYNIVIPWQTSKDEIVARFGRFGVILPSGYPKTDDGWCEDNKNAPDPLLGYTE